MSQPLARIIHGGVGFWDLVGCSTGRSAGLMPRSSLASCLLMISRTINHPKHRLGVPPKVMAVQQNAVVDQNSAGR
jgi:hypothetical protein